MSILEMEMSEIINRYGGIWIIISFIIAIAWTIFKVLRENYGLFSNKEGESK